MSKSQRKYTQTNKGGIKVNKSFSKGLERSVQIYSRSLNKFTNVINGVDNLENIVDEYAKEGDTIYVNPGEYDGQELLKDKVDWHFRDGSTVHNYPNQSRAFFQETGEGVKRCNITGKGNFVYSNGGTHAAEALVNTGSSEDTEIYIEAKRFHVPSGSTAQISLASGGNVEVNLDEWLVTGPTNEDSEYKSAAGALTGGGLGNIKVNVKKARIERSEACVIDIFSGSAITMLASIDELNATGEYGYPIWMTGVGGDTEKDVVSTRIGSMQGNFQWGIVRFSEAKGHVLTTDSNIKFNKEFFSFAGGEATNRCTYIKNTTMDTVVPEDQRGLDVNGSEEFNGNGGLSIATGQENTDYAVCLGGCKTNTFIPDQLEIIGSALLDQSSM